MPVLAGAGGYDTREVIELARDMERVGADGVLSVTPYYNKPTPEGLYQHFKAIAESIHIPVVLYNVPVRTGINLDVKTTVRLSEIPNIVGIKGPGDLVQMSEIISGTRDDFIVLSGDDPVTVATMAVGGAGVVSVGSNEAPTEMVQIVELCERGDYRGRAQAAPLAAAAAAGELRGIESDPLQGRDGGDGSARGELSPADGAAVGGHARQGDRACSSS